MEKIGCVLFLAVGIAQVLLGVAGIHHELGFWGVFAALVAAFGFRFMLPLTIGTYFGAVEVLGWPWWGGLLIAAPGLVLIVPSILAQALESISSAVRR